MTHRERVMAALNHEEADRVPMDLGGCLASTIVAPAYGALRAELGLPALQARSDLKYASLAVIDEDVRTALDVDIVHAPRAFGVGNTIKVLSEDRFIDEWGVLWHKPPKGHYYVEEAPFAKEATPAAVERHAWPHISNLVQTAGLAESIRKLRASTDCAISLELRGRVMSMGQFLRGFEDWLMDLADNAPFVEALLARVTQLQLEANDAILREVGDLVDIVYTSDDLGGQQGPLVSPADVRRFFNPHFRTLWGHVRSHTNAKLMHHCCGSIHPLIPDLIELGVQVLNPIQVSANHMEPAVLKREFGKHLCFWGAVDTRDVMPRGSTGDVREEVRRRIGELGRGGGYVLAAVHNLQVEVPPANVVELFRAGKALGHYLLA